MRETSWKLGTPTIGDSLSELAYLICIYFCDDIYDVVHCFFKSPSSNCAYLLKMHCLVYADQNCFHDGTIVLRTFYIIINYRLIFTRLTIYSNIPDRTFCCILSNPSVYVLKINSSYVCLFGSFWHHYDQENSIHFYRISNPTT